MLRVAWPLVVSMLGYTGMSLADTIMVAQLGTHAVGGVGLATTAYFAISCLGMGLVAGVRVIVAQAHGARDAERARSVAYQGLVVALVVGSVAAAMTPFSELLMNAMSGGSAAAGYGVAYLEIRMPSAMIQFAGAACFAYFDGLGQTKVSMRVRLIANALNVVLDGLLIFGVGPFPAMGVRGAALATVIALAFQGAVALWLLWSRARPDEGRSRFTLRGLRELFEIGGPMGMQWMLEVQSWAVFASLVARVGDAHLAAHAIVVRICSVSFLPGHAIGEAGSILTGQAVGAGDPAAARRAASSASWVAVVVMGAMGLVFLAIPEQLLSVFDPEPEVMRIGVGLLAVAAAFQLFDGLLMTRSGALNGVGDTRFVMLVSVAMAWAMLLPLAWLLCNVAGWGSHGAWIALTVHLMLLSGIFTLRWDGQVAERRARVLLARAADSG